MTDDRPEVAATPVPAGDCSCWHCQNLRAGARTNSPEVLAFCEQECKRLFVPDDVLLDLARRRSREFAPDGAAVAPVICDQIIGALAQGKALSIVRVGNGEGNAFSMTGPLINEAIEQGFDTEFLSQNGIGVPRERALALCRDVTAALADGDIVGFRSFRFDEAELIRKAIALGNVYAALGFLYSRRLAYELLSRGLLEERVVTSAWIHLDFLPYLDRLLQSADSILVITGRAELRRQFELRVGARLRDFVTVPVQGFRPRTVSESHLYDDYPKILRYLEQDLSGTLVLVGAGLFGKVYCRKAKAQGAVSFDLGSAFDVLAGRRSRPIFDVYDVDAYRWT